MLNKKIKKILMITSFVFLSAASKAEISSADYLKDFNAKYDQLLKENVKPNQEKSGIKLALVDYKAMKGNPLLNETKEALQKINPEDLSEEEELAFWINAYNFYTIELITKHYPVKTIKSLGSIFRSVWKRHKFKINGKKYTLDDIEHDIIREKFNRPKTHFALVCASLSCPDLLNEPYKGEKLRMQLTSQTIKFLDNPTKGVMIKDNKVLVSEIFKWYENDFAKGEVLDFIRQFKNIRTIDGYIEYNWNLNSL